MVSPVIIPIVIVAAAAVACYMAYRLVIYDYFCSRSVDSTLLEYGIKKSQADIVREYHESRGEDISDAEVSRLQKYYRQKQPDRFLSMYDELRERAG